MLEVGWISVVQKRCNQVMAEIESHVAKVGSEIRTQSVEARRSNLRLEKIKMPKFDGELRLPYTFRGVSRPSDEHVQFKLQIPEPYIKLKLKELAIKLYQKF